MSAPARAPRMRTARSAARVSALSARAMTLALGALLVGTAQVAGQGAGASDTLPVYEREVFDYPSAGRRDPFRALNTGERLGPRFDDLQLTGVLYNPQIASVATLTDRKTNRLYRVREGDVLGEARILEIRPREVVFLISAYGISRREVLQVKRDKEQQG